MRIILLLTLAVCLVGCSSPKVWYRSDTSAAAAWRDYGDAKMQAARAPYATGGNMSGLGTFMSASIAQGDYLNACMLSKGYRRVPANTVTNGTAFPK
jgi:hypothetical protein